MACPCQARMERSYNGAPQNSQADSEATVWRLHHWHWTFLGTSGSGGAVMFVMLVT